MGFKNKGMWLSSKEADMIDLYRKQSPSVKKATCQQVGVPYDSKKDGKSSKNKKRW